MPIIWAWGLYPTGSKKDASLLAPGMLEKIVQAVKIPVVGIGGIHEAQLDQVLDQGAAGCAMISAILGAEDIGAAVERMKARIRPGRNNRRQLWQAT